MSVEEKKTYKKFYDLKVRFWEERGHYVINAARVGYILIMENFNQKARR